MRFISTFILSILLSSLFAQTGGLDKISSKLAEEMSNNPAAFHPVYIMLEDQVDIQRMHMDFLQSNTPVNERAVQTVTALKAKAGATQQPAWDFLRAEDGVDQATLESLWIINGFSAMMNAQAIDRLSKRGDIKSIEYIERNFLFEDETMDAAPMLAPNGHEPGLSQMNVDKLWALGYTGAGRLSMTIDTGVEWKHPALTGKYQGLYFDESIAYFGNGADGPEDCQGHGTFVTGNIMGLDRMTNDTIGSAFNARWIDGVSFITDENGNSCPAATYGTIALFQRAADPDMNSNTTNDIPDAINCSFGGGSSCGNGGALSNAQNALATIGVAILWAAGNDGPNAGTVSYQAGINTNLVRSFSVGAVTGSSAIAGFSSRGPSACSSSDSSLEIKPEVVARGVSVRSSSPGGGYSVANGTSFATPYTAGVVLLLKEAFPYLSGEDILLAIYMTATDLGTVGEDNIYGNGLVNAFAAYEYLVDQGNVPADPHVANDAIMVGIENQSQECGEGIYTGVVHIENGGTENLTSATVLVQYLQGGQVVAEDQLPWSGNLATQERSTIDIERDDIAGEIYVLATISNPNGVADEKPYNNSIRQVVQVIKKEDAEIVILGGEAGTACDDATNYITVQASDAEISSVEWFFNETSNNVLSSDLIYSMTLANDFTFFADPLYRVKNGGLQNTSDLNVSYSSSSGGLVFDLLADAKIKSTKVYVENGGLNIFRILDSEGNEMKKINLTLQTGENTIDWGDLELLAGKGYVIEKQIGGSLAYASSQQNPSVQFPFNIGSAIYITRSLSGNELYEYFYDWDVEYRGICGRISKTIEFVGDNEGLTASFSNEVSGGSVAFTNTGSTNAASYAWDFGDGQTSTDQNPTHNYTAIGTYNVVFSMITSNGCRVSYLETIEITDLTTSTNNIEAAKYISVFPNPASDILNIDFSFEQQSVVNFKVVDVTGKVIYQSKSGNYLNDELTLNTSNFANGVYYIVFQLEEGNVIKKVVKTN